ncbi:MAG TPA: hypothetical protein VLW75_12045, partial [Rhizomicrobium sp.]|nr:hypothetical protein [Rhizomicrobium sp.]
MPQIPSWAGIPALVPAPGGAVLCAADGACRRAAAEEARGIFRSGDALVAHAMFVSGRLKAPPAKPLYDVLELFAFVRPAQPCVPSALGLARALGLTVPASPEDSARSLHEAAAALIEELKSKPETERAKLRALAFTLARAGWRWGASVLAAIGEPEKSQSPVAGLETWRGLPQWEDEAPPAKPGSLPVASDETRARLRELVGSDGEARPEQAAYAEAATYAFGARERAG